MESIKVSVIIPVYNTAEYLFEALSSISNQSLREIEMIVINDGSSDNSAKVLADFSLLDNRLKTITFKENKGVSVSRNVGFSEAKGEYIYFFDSDDKLVENCLEECYNKSVEMNSDFLIFDGISFVHDGINKGPTLNYQLTKHLTKKSYTGTELLSILNAHKTYSCSVCLCFIKRAYLLKSKLEFYPGILYEDVLFTLQLYMLANSVTYIKNDFFRRRIRPNSTMTAEVTQKTINYRFVVCEELIKAKIRFTDPENRKQINIQTKNMMNYLVKNLIKSSEIKLLSKNIHKIIQIYINAIFT